MGDSPHSPSQSFNSITFFIGLNLTYRCFFCFIIHFAAMLSFGYNLLSRCAFRNTSVSTRFFVHSAVGSVIILRRFL